MSSYLNFLKGTVVFALSVINAVVYSTGDTFILVCNHFISSFFRRLAAADYEIQF